MDRNLGAETTDYTQPASRGLYYEWGRKDPMIYSSLLREAIWNEPCRGDITYAPGFEYELCDPKEYSVPYDVMTIEWSIQHPTWYMYDASLKIGSRGSRSRTGFMIPIRICGATEPPVRRSL